MTLYFCYRIDTSPETTQNLQLVRPRSINVFRKGAVAALDRGPKLGGNIINTQMVLHNLKIGRGTADSFLMSAAAQCVQKVNFIIFCVCVCVCVNYRFLN